MIDLYGITSPNVLKIMLMLEETGLPYRFVPVNTWSGEQFKPEFLRLNPNGKVPVVVDSEGPGGGSYTVFESGAILLYLAEKTGRLLPAGHVARFDVLQWLMLQLTGIGPALGQFIYFTRFASEPQNDHARSRYTTQLLRLLDVVEIRLSQSAYLGGPDYSIADVSTFPGIRSLPMFGVELTPRPATALWAQTIAARSAVQRMDLKLEALRPGMMANMAAAGEEDKDRLFGRRGFARPL